MTQEEKELVIKDLCGRLPYGVIVQVNDGLRGIYDRRLVQVFCDRLSCSVNVCNPLKECICIDSVKPYLRPMSSMTDEEKDKWFNCYHDAELEEVKKSGDYFKASLIGDTMKYDWLNKSMFDYRYLIPNRLASVAPEGMYENASDVV